MSALEAPPRWLHSSAMQWRVAVTALLTSLGVALLIASRAEPLVIRNASPSVPIGFYVRSNDAPTRGRFVTVRAALVAPHYARLRDFADPTDRFIKRVVAVSGDVVCAQDDRVQVGDRLIVMRTPVDRAGRALPRWEGCRALMSNEVFLLGDTGDSFDSRYWGPVQLHDIGGVWTPLFTRPITARGAAVQHGRAREQ